MAQTMCGGSAAPSKSKAKNNLSAMLAKRASRPDVNKTVDASSSPGGRPALKNDTKYDKYCKMLKGEKP